MTIRSLTVTQNGATILVAARDQGVSLPSDCNGHGHCGKCRIRFAEHAPEPTAADRSLVEADDLARGHRLACQHTVDHEVRIEFNDASSNALIQVDAYGGRSVRISGAPPGRHGVAIDVGTTTVAVALVDLGSGQLITTVSALNPQSRYGADVLSRISHTAKHGTDELQDLILSAIREGISQCADEAGITLDSIDEISLCGNTTMMYLARGLDPTPLSTYPFFAEHLSMADVDAAAALTMPALGDCRLRFLPGISAYVGADVLSGLYFCGADEFGGVPKLFIDIGTNGEIALILDHEIICTATAAGPAFEGASISCGVGSIDGAINRVWLDDAGVAQYSTIGDRPAVGVCGSAIVDMLVWGLASKQIQPSGRMPQDLALPDTPVPISLSQTDVRNLQLAKAAIRSGMQMMLRQANLRPSEVGQLLIAGGFGRYLDKDNAALIGLLPSRQEGSIVSLGNAALGGCILALLDPLFESRCQQIIDRAHAIDLSSQSDFNTLFIHNIPFPRTTTKE